jgi:YVTN family beta-propeller protein
MGRRLALLIATYDYQDAGLRRLTSPAHDAEAFAGVLTNPDIAGFEVTTLINEPHHRVGEAIGDLYRDRRRDDLTLLYFTGHGLKDEDGRLYLATANTRRDSLLFTSLPAEQIDQAMSGCMSRQNVLILDCCYSGAFPVGRMAKADTDVHTLERFHGQGRTVLTASDATQYSFEGNQPTGTAAQSVFTRYLVAGLRDGSADLDGDGDITLDELYSYVHDRVVDEVPQQRPKKQDNVVGRIVIARNINWSLPSYLRHALASPIAADRLAALDGLVHLHRIGNDLVRGQVTDEIRRLADDDSRVVSATAAARLEAILARAPGNSGSLVSGPVSEPVSEPTTEPTSDSPSPLPPPVATPLQASPVAEVPEALPGTPAEPAPSSEAGRGARIRQGIKALCTEAWGHAGNLVRGLRLGAVLGLVPITAAALLVAALFEQSRALGDRLFVAGPWWGMTWYVVGTAVVASIAGVCMLLPRTRSLIGPGILLGAAAASAWGLAYFSTRLAQGGSDTADRFGFAGHVTLLLAACVAGFALRGNRAVRFEMRRPADSLTWVVALVGGAGAMAGAWALSGEVRLSAPADLALPYMAATVLAVTVPVWAAVVPPRAFGLSLLAGWAGGAAAIAFDSSQGWWGEHTDEWDKNATTFGWTLPVLLAAGLVAFRWSTTTPLVRLRRTALIAGLTVVPLLAATALVVTYYQGPTPRAGLTAQSFGVAVGPDSSRVYVTMQGAEKKPGHVSVIDATTDKIIGEPIPVGITPTDVAVSRDGDYVYVANSGAGSVSVISTLENETVGKPIPVGGVPRDLTITSDGRLFVFNNQSHDVSVIDTGTNTTIGDPIPLGAAPHAAAVSPDGSRLYVVRGKSGDLSVIDTATRKTTDTSVTLGYAPHALAPSPDGHRLYATNTDNSLSVIDTTTGKEIGHPDSLEEGDLIAVSPNGRRAYVTNLFGQGVSVIDTKTNTAVGAPVTVDGPPTDVAVSPDGRRVYVTLFEGESASEVAVFKTDEPDAVTTIDLKTP